MENERLTEALKGTLAKHLRAGDETFLYQMQRHYLCLPALDAAEFWLTGTPSLARVIENFIEGLERHGLVETYVEVLLDHGQSSDPAITSMLDELREVMPHSPRPARPHVIDKMLRPQAIELASPVFSVLDYLERHQRDCATRETFPYLNADEFNAKRRVMTLEYHSAADGEADTLDVTTYPAVLRGSGSQPQLSFRLSSNPSHPQGSFIYNPRGLLDPHYRVKIFSLRKLEIEIAIEPVDDSARRRLIIPVRFQAPATVES